MQYHIKNEYGTIIASFVNDSDRGYAFEALLEAFPDCELFTYDDD